MNWEIIDRRVTYGSVLKAIKEKGICMKKVVERIGETSSLKESRIWFYAEVAKFICKSYQKLIFFGWTSFGQNEFKKHVWGSIGSK